MVTELAHVTTRALALMLFFCSTWKGAMADEKTACINPLGHVRADELSCGCYIRIPQLVCTPSPSSYRPHLFTGLETDAPLLLHYQGKDMSLAHIRHVGASVKGDAGGSWTDSYRSAELSVRVRYTPGKSTCPKPVEEGCEYSDYNATVTLTPKDQPAYTLKGTAKCGC